jgi:predicted RecB family nuclease
MIGVGFNNKENNWEFKSFILEEKTKESERKMLDDFWLYINGKLKEYNKKESIFIHWSQAEKIVYEKIQLRHLNLENKKLIDLYQVFINEPIVVKGALNYSLKTIANALKKNDLIKVNWNSSNPCSNGLNAMIMAIKCYEKNKKISNEIPTIKNIEEYNEVDCKSLYEILNYLRKHH